MMSPLCRTLSDLAQFVRIWKALSSSHHVGRPLSGTLHICVYETLLGNESPREINRNHFGRSATAIARTRYGLTLNPFGTSQSKDQQLANWHKEGP